MTSSMQSNAEHQDIWEIIPWLVNGRLSDRDRRRAEAHLQICSDCRAECEAQRKVHDVLSADTGVEWAPAAGLNKLRQRIRSGDSVDPVNAQSDAMPRRWSGRHVAVAASIVTAALAVAVVALGYRYLPGWHAGNGSYYTVTAVAPQRAGAVIRAVFSPAATLSELQTLLDDAHLRIVSGPTEAGVYSLAMTGSQSVDWSLRRLRGHETVRFAETVGPAVVPPAP